MVIDGYGELCFSLRSVPPPHWPALPVVDAGRPLVRQGVHHQRLDAAGEGDVTIVPGVGRIIKAVPLFLCDVPLCKVGSLDMGQVFFDVQDQFQLLRSVVPPSTVIFLSVMRLPRLSTSPWNSSMRLRINQPPPRRRPGGSSASGRRWGTAGLAGPSSLHGPFRHQFHSAEHGRCRAASMSGVLAAGADSPPGPRPAPPAALV